MVCMSIMYEQVHTEYLLFSSYAYSYFAKIFGQKPIFRKFSFCTCVCKNLISKYLKQSVYILSSGDKGLFFMKIRKKIFYHLLMLMWCVGGCCICMCVLIIFYFICFVWHYFLPNDSFFRTLFFAFFFHLL